MIERSQDAAAIAAGLRLEPVHERMQQRPDHWLLGMVALLTSIGLLFVLNASSYVSDRHFGDAYHMFFKHLVSACLGVGLLWVCSRAHSSILERRAGLLFAGSLVLLLLTLVPGLSVEVNGARRWIWLGVFNLQPSELTKITFVLAVSAWLVRVENVKNPLHTIVPVLGAFGLLGAVLMEQPDFGTAVLLGVITVVLLLLGGVPLWQLVLPGGLLGAGGVWFVMSEDYRMRRVLTFLDPTLDPQGDGYQLLHALTAFGSGGLHGQGIGNSTQKVGYLPEPHTDFIFAVIGEETGFVGATFIVLLFALLVWRGLRIAHLHRSHFAQMVAAGLTLVIAFQAMFNVGVVLGMLPTKGIGLPFVSYGGSSIMVFLAMAGLLLALSRELRVQRER
jgi:cell division protein FtsW